MAPGYLSTSSGCKRSFGRPFVKRSKSSVCLLNEQVDESGKAVLDLERQGRRQNNPDLISCQHHWLTRKRTWAYRKLMRGCRPRRAMGSRKGGKLA